MGISANLGCHLAKALLCLGKSRLHGGVVFHDQSGCPPGSGGQTATATSKPAGNPSVGPGPAGNGGRAMALRRAARSPSDQHGWVSGWETSLRTTLSRLPQVQWLSLATG